MAKSYFITGATGFVGVNILRALLNENESNKVILLIRKSGGLSALQRMRNMLSEVYSLQKCNEYLKRIDVVEGNVTQEKFGLTEVEFHKLAQRTNIIFHSAASIKFNLPLEEAAAINIQGTKNILEFAQLCKKYNSLEKYNHISTAYVIGRKKKVDDLSKCRDFINTYEITKFEAESIVNKHINAGLPATIFRPSIITCNSQTGEISKNSIIYIFLMLICRGILSQLPADEESSLNLVPINYFIDIMLKISRLPESNGRSFNICNRKNGQVRKMFTYVCEQLGIHKPEYISISSSNLIPPRLLSQIESFIPYIEESHTFDLSETQQILKKEYYECEDNFVCISHMIKYCIENKLLIVKNKSRKELINY